MIESIFIHIPRTGGTALKWALNGKIHDLEYMNKQDHRPASKRKPITPNWDNVYKFTIIRNPWARAVSLYHKCDAKLDFVKWVLSEDLDQSEFFTQDNEILVDDVFRYEELHQSLQIICQRAGWPTLSLDLWLGKKANRRYNDYYSSSLVSRLEDKWHTFNTLYGYDYENLD